LPLQIFPLHLQIFPFHLVESRILSPLVYINSVSPLTHEFGKRQAAFIPKKIQNPTHVLGPSAGVAAGLGFQGENRPERPNTQ
jgi:hypothetical protein